MSKTLTQDQAAALSWSIGADAASKVQAAYEALLLIASGAHIVIPATPASAEQEREVFEMALNPRRWTREMSQAWHRAIPDVQKAFDDLKAAALAAQTKQGDT